MRKLILFLLVVIVTMLVPVAAQSEQHRPVNAPTGIEIASGLDRAPARPVILWDIVPSATEYAVYIQAETGTQMLYEWFDSEDVYCDFYPGVCFMGDLVTLDAVYPAWGLLNGDYEVWVGARGTDGSTAWSGGPSYGPVSFEVDVPLPTVRFEGGWLNSMPVVGFAYNPDTTLFVQVYVGGEGEQHLQWIDVQNHPMCGLEATYEDFPEGCILVGTDLPIYWGPGTYEIWGQAWGPGGFSSPDGSNSAASWAEANFYYGGVNAMIFPATPPDPPTNLSGWSLFPIMSISWDEVPNAPWYHVVITNLGGTVYDEWHHGSELIDQSTDDIIGCRLTACAFYTNFNVEATYSVYISTWGPGGFSAGSAFIQVDHTDD